MIDFAGPRELKGRSFTDYKWYTGFANKCSAILGQSSSDPYIFVIVNMDRFSGLKQVDPTTIIESTMCSDYYGNTIFEYDFLRNVSDPNITGRVHLNPTTFQYNLTTFRESIPLIGEEWECIDTRPADIFPSTKYSINEEVYSYCRRPLYRGLTLKGEIAYGNPQSSCIGYNGEQCYLMQPDDRKFFDPTMSILSEQPLNKGQGQEPIFVYKDSLKRCVFYKKNVDLSQSIFEGDVLENSSDTSIKGTLFYDKNTVSYVLQTDSGEILPLSSIVNMVI